MNQVNFLPRSYVLEQRRLRRVYREALLIVFTMMAMAGWYTFDRGSLTDMRLYAQTIEDQILAVREQNSEIARLQMQQASLSHQVKIQQQLGQPVSHSTIIATLATSMRPPMTVSELVMVSVRPPPEMKKAEAKSGRGSRKSKGAKDENAPPPPNFIRVELTGLSPNDLEIANFVGRLTENPLFVNVKLPVSRPIEVGRALAREFKVELEVPLDRQYAFGQQAREASHAP